MPKVQHSGLFKPGQSGNPNGRPKVVSEFVEMLREKTPRAVERLIEIIEQKRDLGAAAAAAKFLIERAYGKAPQAVDLNVGGAGLQVSVQILDSSVKPKS
jgi:hypothetical protein